jgi:hypothetical protein
VNRKKAGATKRLMDCSFARREWLLEPTFFTSTGIVPHQFF